MKVRKIGNYKKYDRLTRKIKKLLPSYREMSDEVLQMQTEIFKKRLENGEELEKLLPEAYCVVIEADRRVLGLEPYDVQILGAVMLFFGNVAEMKTGEGKTLTATMPMYLRGLAGEGNFLVTANEYLACRDAAEVGKVYRWLGLSVAVGVKKNEYDQEIDKETVYRSNIVYTTHSSLGFDYLFDNLAVEKEKQYLQGFNFVIIDELDSILLDVATTPLIVSGAPMTQSNLYKMVDTFIKSLIFEEDYDISEETRSIWFLEAGITRAEQYFDVNSLLSEAHKDLYRHLMLSLRANYILKSNKDYIIEEDKIILLDETTGRKLQGNKLQGGQHQAIEAKEKVKITNETKSMGSITYQNLFRKFKLLSGMTGTAITDAQELKDTYGIEVISLPTHRPLIRVDHKEQVYTTEKTKLLETLALVERAVEIERPVLIATGSVSKSLLYSMLLLRKRLPHSVLNASTTSTEQQVIAEAGKRGAITVATALAGRGTDIKLDDFSQKNGGLLVIGTENMSSERVDNQIRGRAGRQGEPGESYFFASLEDRLVIENAPRWAKKNQGSVKQKTKHTHDESVNGELGKRKYLRLVQKSQKNKKNSDVEIRRSTLDYDDIMSLIRERFYATRNRVLEAETDYFDDIIEKSFKQMISLFVTRKQNLNQHRISEFILNNIDFSYDRGELENKQSSNRKVVGDLLADKISQCVKRLENQLSDPIQLDYYKRVIILKSVDTIWIDLSDGLNQLKSVVQNRNWGQHQPLYEFQKEANRYFTESIDRLWLEITRNLLLSEVFVNPDGSADIEFP
ncbi:accessory Sec system translocase SecA2 [Pseudolactococcus yaeyamensis]